MAMNRARRTSNLNNILTYDTLGNSTLIANLTVEGLTGAGFVKADAAGLLSVDTAAYTVVTGATNYLTKITGANTLGQSLVYDNGTSVLVNSITGVPGYAHAFQIVANAAGGLVVSTTDVASAIGIVNSSSANKTWDISPYGNHLVINESGIATRMKFDAGGNITIGDIVNTGHKLEIVGSFRTTGTNTLSQLQGVGDRMVVANTNGVLSTQAIPTGSITGSGAAGQVNFWTGAATVSGSNNLFWDAANARLGIGTNAPISKIETFSNSIYIAGAFSMYSNTASDEALFYFRRGRGTLASPLIVQTGDVLGSLRFAAQFNSTVGGYNTNAKIESVVEANGADLRFYTNNGGIPNATISEKFRIFGNGNVAIQNGGTFTDLGQRLQVMGDTFVRGTGNTNTTNALAVQNSDSVNIFRVSNNGRVTLASTPIIESTTGSIILSSVDNPTRTLTYDTLNNTLTFSQFGTQALIGARFQSPSDSTVFISPDGINAPGSAKITSYDSAGNASINASNNGNRSIVLKGLGSTGAVLIGAITTGNGTSYNAILRADSTTQGFMPPRMTAVQRAAIASPTDGLMVYQTDGVAGMYVYTDGAWVNGSSGSGAAGQVTYWNSASGLTGSANLFWDNTNGRLGINNNTPTSALFLYTNTSSTTESGNSGFILHNNNPSQTVGNLTELFFSDAGQGTGTANGLNLLHRYAGVAGFTNQWNAQSSGGGLNLVTKATTAAALTTKLQIRPGGNVIIQDGGTFTDAGFRLDVQGTARTTGTHRVGQIFFGTNSQGSYLFPHAGTAGVADQNGLNLTLYNYSTSTTPQGSWAFAGELITATSGVHSGIRYQKGFSPASGTATHTAMEFIHTINQAGGANGVTRAIRISPSIVTAADFRAIEWANNSGWGLYGVGSSLNYLNGSLLIGSATNDTVNKLQVTGTIVAGSVTSTNGSVILRGNYTNGYLTTIGTDASSGGPMISYGVESAQNSTAGAFVSSSGIAIPRSAYVQTGGHIWYTAASSTTAIGTAVTMTKHMELYNSGNLVLGGGADNAVNRLQVVGDTFLKGSGNTNATIALQVQNSDGTNLIRAGNNNVVTVTNLSVTNSGSTTLTMPGNNYFFHDAVGSQSRLIFYAGNSLKIGFGSSGNGITINPSSAAVNELSGEINVAQRTLRNVAIYAASVASAISGANTAGTFTANGTVGFDPTNNHAGGHLIGMYSAETFNPNNTLKDVNYSAARLSPIINQTGGAVSATRGLLVSPTLTAAADWRSIEWSNNTGWGLYGVGTSKNYLNGTTLIGTLTDDGVNKLQVAGSISSTGIMRSDASRTAAINDVSIALLGSNITTYAAGFTMAGAGYGLNAVYAQHEQRFGGNANFDSANLVGAGLMINKLAPTAAGTVTMGQAAGRIRTMSNLHLMTQFEGNNNLTVTHMSGLHIYGHYRTSGTGVLTVSTAYYGIFLADPNEFSTGATVTGGNYGFYQQGTAPYNYFGGKVSIGTTATDGTSKLRISGLPTSSAGLLTGEVWSNGGVLTIV